MNKKFYCTKEELEIMYNNYSSGKIAQKFHLDRSTILYWLHKYNIPIKKSNSYKRTLGYKHTNETKEKIAKTRLGKKWSQETKNKMSNTMRSTKCHAGKRNGRWIDGRNLLRHCVRHLNEYKMWVSQIFKRDEGICQYCFRKSCKVEIHHLIRFNWILTVILNRYPSLSP